jgi:hypothetical protein
MADERLDASWRRMKRVGFWLVIIDAKHMKSDFKSDLASKWASVPHDSPVCYLLFPISEIDWPNSVMFHPRRLVGAGRNRHLTIQGCLLRLVQPNNRLTAGCLRC